MAASQGGMLPNLTGLRYGLLDYTGRYNIQRRLPGSRGPGVNNSNGDGAAGEPVRYSCRDTTLALCPCLFP